MKNLKNNIVLFILSSAWLVSCFDVPDEFVAPAWDVELNIPVSSKQYSLADIIKNDPQFVVNNNDPASLGKISYTQNVEFLNHGFSGGLTLETFESTFSQKIEEIKIEPIEPMTIDVRSEDLMPGLSGGSNQILPSFQVPFSSNFITSSDFESITFASGQLNFKFINKFPVEIEIRGFEIINNSDGSIVFSRSSGSADWVIIPANDSVSIPIDLQDKTITGELRLSTQIYSAGSGTQTVYIPAESALEFKMEMEESFVISSVVAPLPSQGPFISENSIAIQTGDQPTRFQRAVIESGSFNITLDNYFDLDITILLTVDNLFRSDGSKFTRLFTLNRNERNKVIEENSISGWVFDNNGIPSEYISFQFEISTAEASGLRELALNDSVGLNIYFGDITLESFIGVITPTEIEIPVESSELDLGDLEAIFSFDELTLDEPSLILQVSSPTTFELLFNGKIDISNGYENKELYLNNILLQPAGVTSIQLADFGLEDILNSFSNKFPQSFGLSGNAIINPNYKLGSISSTDSISSNLDVNIPLSAGITGGIFVDTFENTFGEDIDEIDNLNYVLLTLEMTNEIPLSLACVGTFNDSSGTNVLNFPPRPLYPSNKDTLFVDPPRVDLKGNLISAGYRIQELELFGDEVQKFLRSPSMTFQVKFITPPIGNNIPVSFKISDELNFKISAKASYRVDLN